MTYSSRTALMTGRWYCAWLMIGCLVLILALYIVWIPLSRMELIGGNYADDDDEERAGDDKIDSDNYKNIKDIGVNNPSTPTVSQNNYNSNPNERGNTMDDML